MNPYLFLMVYFATVPSVCWACGSIDIGHNDTDWWCNNCGAGGPLPK